MFRRAVLFLASAHLINDFLNNIVNVILPLLQAHFKLSYGEVGILTMTASVSSSLVQPLFGYLSDRKGSPWVLPFGALALGIGLLWLPNAPSFVWMLPAVVLSGFGSAAFHPDASRAVYFAAGSQRGLAQSIFQIGGNSGMALSPVAFRFLTAVGIKGTAWFMGLAVISTALMSTLIPWFSSSLKTYRTTKKSARRTGETNRRGLTLLVGIVTIRSWVVSGIIVFVPLFVIHHYHVAMRNVWVYSFTYLLAGAVGTMVGGPISDRLGQRRVIRLSLFLSIPLALILPYLSQGLILVDLAALGFVALSTFAVTVIYGQEMAPGNIAMVSGMLIGFAGGVGGLGTMLLGYVADAYGLSLALKVLVWAMPLAALCSLALPEDKRTRSRLPASIATTAVK